LKTFSLEALRKRTSFPQDFNCVCDERYLLIAHLLLIAAFCAGFAAGHSRLAARRFIRVSNRKRACEQCGQKAEHSEFTHDNTSLSQK
jgi:hypothetical protein